MVTTFAVVWIEIASHALNASTVESPPSRWCGLKLHDDFVVKAKPESPPSRWCGLKLTG